MFVKFECEMIMMNSSSSSRFSWSELAIATSSVCERAEDVLTDAPGERHELGEVKKGDVRFVRPLPVVVNQVSDFFERPC